MEAFRNSVRNGANMIETDIFMTADDKLVAFHDLDLLRLCGKN